MDDGAEHGVGLLDRVGVARIDGVTVMTVGPHSWGFLSTDAPIRPAVRPSVTGADEAGGVDCLRRRPVGPSLSDLADLVAIVLVVLAVVLGSIGGPPQVGGLLGAIGGGVLAVLALPYLVEPSRAPRRLSGPSSSLAVC